MKKQSNKLSKESISKYNVTSSRFFICGLVDSKSTNDEFLGHSPIHTQVVFKTLSNIF